MPALRALPRRPTAAALLGITVDPNGTNEIPVSLLIIDPARRGSEDFLASDRHTEGGGVDLGRRFLEGKSG
jgi:hypothetical protein